MRMYVLIAVLQLLRLGFPSLLGLHCLFHVMFANSSEQKDIGLPGGLVPEARFPYRVSLGILASFNRLTLSSQRKRLLDSRGNRLGIPAFAKTSLLGMRSCQVVPWIFRRQRKWNLLSLRSWLVCRVQLSFTAVMQNVEYTGFIYHRHGFHGQHSVVPLPLVQALLIPCRSTCLVLCLEIG